MMHTVRRSGTRSRPSLLIWMAISTMTVACSPQKPPNVLFILVDDLGWADLGCYGSTFYETPRLDELARRSIRFTEAYSASPVCSPTRAAILTGKHPARVGITDWIPGMDPGRVDSALLITPEDLHNMPLEEVTMAEIFRENGYRTFFAGKWHLGENEAFWPTAQGFDANAGGNHMGSPTFPGGNGYYAPYANPTLAEGPEGEYLTDRLTDESIRFMESVNGAPFFLYLAFYTVHTPIQGCLAYDSLYTEKSRLLPDSGRMLLSPEHEGMTRINQSDPHYAAMIRSLDSNVGRLLDHLEQAGELGNTILVFTSDNGGLSTTRNGGPTSVVPLRAGKGWCYEGGVRVPLMVTFPGISRPGSRSRQPVISMDYLPTLVELAGLRSGPLPETDGISLVPVLLDPETLFERSLVWHYPHYHGSTWRPGSAIRSNRWKLVEFYENSVTELYDLSRDQGERTDLSDRFPELVDSLRSELHTTLHAMNAQYPEMK